ncbi:hypothetical protein FV232_23110 [Methylobacterium sp. WL30]|uniref:hypothetical protein n=1 Tax=unclassified Methylobacterium TaxID=2615210 RepID=UPI0011C822E0|nr:MULTISPECIES: hypothetical protein [unclassified Methylobacterium]TXN34199.1 hypothetical protein FV225_17360 [Methylobacterium sp. WL93]TXN45346.1 hypothetical protein FV227_25195 [Methylobacterium sp. WL119]TXN63510.1 hypothetical protein FV232_23110 [Methylobacterium sp. WL30]
MGYRHRNPQNRMKAASLLRLLKGRLIDVSGVKVEVSSNATASAEAYWQLSKASGVHVYQEGDGWHADLEFKGLPDGVPAMIGTPAPVSTRAEAIESVVGTMSVCAQRDAVQAPDTATVMRWFRFDDHEVPVHPKMLSDYIERAKALGTDPADVLSDLDDIRIEITGGGPVTREAWDAASFQSRYDACKFCCIAMAVGISQVTFDPGSPRMAPDAYPALGLH